MDLKYIPHLISVVLAFLLASSLDYSAALEREIAGLQAGLANTPDTEHVSACSFEGDTNMASAESSLVR